MLKKILVIAVLAVGYYQWSHGSWIGLESPLPRAAGFSQAEPDLSRAPIQRELRKSGLAFRFENYTIRPLASFQGKARVLSTKRYRSGREADLSPVDLALGWGPMAEDQVLDSIRIRQSGRFYFWRVEQFPIPRRAIETHSANMHMIPANREIEQRLREIEAGEIIHFKGYLVRVDADDGWQWVSSLSREDIGGGACELVLVEAVL